MGLGLLNGLSVLITRPREQSEAAAAYIVEQGGSPLIFPTLEIIPVEPAGGWAVVLEKLAAADIAVFTSANAVRQVLSQEALDFGGCQCAAIGTATQMALQAEGISCDWLPMRDYRSEGLLALPVFQDVQGKRIVLFAGEGGRDYLQEVLTERGAQIEKIAVYRRVCPKTETTALEQFFARKGQKIMVSTSVESLTHLLTLSAGLGDPRVLPLLVISERMASAATAHGFQTVVIAENAGNEAIVRALAAWL